MPWPLSQDYNEAIQEPAQCFADSELKQGEAVTNALGLPVPCSGNFADVYAVQAGTRKWAVKCFTRQVPGLQERYAQISQYLQNANLPFMVEFQFLGQGIRVRGTWYPVLKMQWVEGFQLNTFVRDNLGKPQLLQTLCQIWLKLAKRLREANLAHCDLQHGNVLLVPSKAGALGVRLVDYDGMCVPALEGHKTIEVGHAAYQHPQRLKEGSYGLHIDRVPHLVIYTAIKALSVRGKELWDRFDNGDNLLFKQPDLEAPDRSEVFQELRKVNDAKVQTLTQALAEALRKPIEQAPLLEEMVEAKAAPSASPAAVAAVKPAPLTPAANPAVAMPTAPELVPPILGRRPSSAAKKKSYLGLIIAGSVAAVVFLAGIVVLAMLRGPATSPRVVVAEAERTRPSRSSVGAESPTAVQPVIVEPKSDPKVVVPPEPKDEPKIVPPVELPPEPQDTRLAAPPAGDQAEADKRIKQAFKAEYARVEAAKDRRAAHLALATKLFDKAATIQDDPTERFVLLRESRDQAILAGGGASALKAVNQLGREFAINVAQAKADVLEAVAKRTVQTPANKLLVTEALEVLTEVLKEEDADAAERIFKVAQTAAKNTGVAPVMATVEEKRGAVEAKQKEAAQLKAARDTLEKDPVDPDANLVLGRHLSLIQGHWDEGLPMLAKASDAKLRALAVKDLSTPGPGAERAELGDGWWDLAATLKDKARANVRRRAYYWYFNALAGLDGAVKLRAEQRMGEVATQFPYLARNKQSTKSLRLRNRAYVELANTRGVVDLNGTFTIEMWVRLRPGVQYLVGDESWPGAGEPGSGARGFVIRTGGSQGGNWEFNFTMAFGPENWWLATGPQRRITDEWQHIAVCKTLDEVRLFWDGKLYTSRAIKGEKFIPCNSNIFLGVRRNGWQDRQVDADYRAVRISRKAVYQNDFTPPQQLDKTDDTSVLLDFSTAEGKVIPDLSGKKHDGTISGGTWLEQSTGPVPNVQILFARYGAFDTWHDVTMKAQKLVKGSQLSLRPEDVFVGDPLFGKHKSLILVYRTGNKTVLAIRGNSAESPLPVPPGPGTYYQEVVTSQTSKFTVLAARWGADTGWADVTASLAKLSDGTKIAVIPEKELNDPDPAPNKSKSLVVLFTHSGKLYLSVTGGSTITALPRP
jgi:hypothetical protein